LNRQGGLTEWLLGKRSIKEEFFSHINLAVYKLGIGNSGASLVSVSLESF
jgi:hypothetical protein